LVPPETRHSQEFGNKNNGDDEDDDDDEDDEEEDDDEASRPQSCLMRSNFTAVSGS
jgi:hypothetical protein